MVLPKYLYFIPFFFSISAFILAFVGTACDYLQFTSTTPITNPITGISEPVTLKFGYWYYQSWTLNNSTADYEPVSGDSCDFYPSTVHVDNNWKAARAFNLIAIIGGGSIILLDIFQGCMSIKRNESFRLGAIGYMICCLCTGLSLILLDSSLCKNNTLIEELNQSIIGEGVQFPDTCTISKGGKASIAACVLWFVASVGTMVLHQSFRKKDRGNGIDDEGLDEPLFIDSQVL